jgi:hypothetical protein
VQFTTWTLRYNRAFWVTVEGLEKHWERADIDADVTVADSMIVRTKNVSAFSLDIPANGGLITDYKLYLQIDQQAPEGYSAQTGKDGSLRVHFQKTDGHWREVKAFDEGLRKRHGLQGPIDDAFMDAFLIVKPTGKALNEGTATWAAAEAEHAILHWHKQFRGEARVKNDVDVTEADLRDYNVVLFGDPGSNSVMKKIAGKLPVGWTGKEITVGAKAYDAGHHAVAMIYPNPLNPQRYVVLNSGFTFRELDYLNNARQTPKLPDWAVIDTATPVTATGPGTVVEAGFFDEGWGLGK